jgi:hypothetical protein
VPVGCDDEVLLTGGFTAIRRGPRGEPRGKTTRAYAFGASIQA